VRIDAPRMLSAVRVMVFLHGTAIMVVEDDCEALTVPVV
jgi:hypothetical protein